MSRKLFCEISPLCYNISLKKEYLLRDLHDLFSGEKFAVHRGNEEQLPVIVKSHRSVIRRKLDGVDMKLQENKAVNLAIAAAVTDGIIVYPGETFSFWRTVGEPAAEKGYLEGLTISRKGMGKAVGGGLCQLANLIHWMVLNSPMTVTELHHHSDALFPDSGRRVPFGTGTSVFYKNVDYRFRNTTDIPVQIRVYIQDGDLCGELRSTEVFPFRYRITEEDNGFSPENGIYYRNSRIYRHVIRRSDNTETACELILENHSRVMYDYDLIPKDKIR
ncbi:MAG: VanW family protein [Huintestinicola sp.]